jgi:hypothetical protein
MTEGRDATPPRNPVAHPHPPQDVLKILKIFKNLKVADREVLECLDVPHASVEAIRSSRMSRGSRSQGLCP